MIVNYLYKQSVENLSAVAGRFLDSQVSDTTPPEELTLSYS